MNHSVLGPLIGGAIIGLSVSAMLLLNGRVTGISGILAGVLSPKKNDTLWRALFIIGLATGGIVLQVITPESLVNLTDRTLTVTAIGGALVGFGSVMGSGCTSGHGVCGISRFSARSLIATLTFIALGMLTVAAFNYFFGA